MFACKPDCNVQSVKKLSESSFLTIEGTFAESVAVDERYPLYMYQR